MARKQLYLDEKVILDERYLSAVIDKLKTRHRFIDNIYDLVDIDDKINHKKFLILRLYDNYLYHVGS